MRVAGARRLHVPGWTGPLIEDAEPDTVEGAGALDDGLNLMAQSGRRRIVRGGARVAQTFGDVTSNPVTNCWGPFRYTASGAVAVAHVPANSKHYAYALTDECAFVAATEALSRGDLSWNSATAGRPLAVELFEKVYFVDATESASRQGMSVGVWASGAWTVTQPTYDLDGSGGSPGVLRAYTAEVFNGVLFVSGYDSESAPSSGNAPHLLRHSLLGTDPSASGGFDPNAYAILGAKGQYVRAMKSGRTVMLAAKGSELYAISGFGRSLPGWQYQIQQVSNSLGAGCTNPYALDHAYGTWYGVGRVGPWRCNGDTVELLRAGRDRSWGRVQNVQLATVTAHPDRRQVWFGFHEVGRSGYAVAPCTYWVWDLEREQWDVNQRTNRSYHYLGTVLQGASVAPDGTPGAPAQDTDDSAFFPDAIEITFTPADTAAQTEVWYRNATGGASTLFATLADGLSRARLSGLSGSSQYYVKLRHSRSGVVSDFSNETLCYTRMIPNPVYAGTVATTDTETSRTVQIVNYTAGADVSVAANSGGYSASYPTATFGTQSGSDASPFGTMYTADANHSAWPSGQQDVLSTVCYQVGVGTPTPPQPSQDLTGLGETAIGVLFWPQAHGHTYRLEYSTPSLPFTFTDAGVSYTSPAAGNALAPTSLGIGGLTAGVAYNVRLRDSTTASVSSVVTMYTKLPAPSVVAATSTGAGTPVVSVDVTIGGSFKIHLYNADRSYENLSAVLGSGTHNFATTAGTCGQRDIYYARTYSASWPLGYQYSDPASDTVDNPCLVGS